jgi:hypothetical protein
MRGASPQELSRNIQALVHKRVTEARAKAGNANAQAARHPAVPPQATRAAAPSAAATAPMRPNVVRTTPIRPAAAAPVQFRPSAAQNYPVRLPPPTPVGARRLGPTAG